MNFYITIDLERGELMGASIQQLKNDYKSRKIVPFIGAGLSAPFRVPTWRSLIAEITETYTQGKPGFIKESIIYSLDRNDYWKAIHDLKYFTSIVDQDIQTEINRIIRAKMVNLEDESQHNYVDLRDMNFNLFLTTNYEHLLHKYLNCDDIPILLNDINFSTQELFDTRQVCHLHGHISNQGSIVISKESYQDLYSNDKYDNLLRLITGTRKLLFMGFSFDDQFIRTLIKDHKSYFNGNHYIILNKPDNEKIKELREQYGLVTIEYNAADSDHTNEIRKILRAISLEESNPETDGATTVENQSIVVGAGISDMEKSVENNLFFKKLVLEDIDPALVDLSAHFYIAAEIYIRDLKRNGFSLKIIDAMLRKVLILYKEKFVDTFNRFGDSQQFLEVVHNSLRNIDYGRLAQSISSNQVSDEDENMGLIHILADDSKMQVWWGEKRLNEEVKDREEIEAKKTVDSTTID